MLCALVVNTHQRTTESFTSVQNTPTSSFFGNRWPKRSLPPPKELSYSGAVLICSLLGFVVVFFNPKPQVSIGTHLISPSSGRSKLLDQTTWQAALQSERWTPGVCKVSCKSIRYLTLQNERQGWCSITLWSHGAVRRTCSQEGWRLQAVGFPV